MLPFELLTLKHRYKSVFGAAQLRLQLSKLLGLFRAWLRAQRHAPECLPWTVSLGLAWPVLSYIIAWDHQAQWFNAVTHTLFFAFVSRCIASCSSKHYIFLPPPIRENPSFCTFSILPPRQFDIYGLFSLCNKIRASAQDGGISRTSASLPRRLLVPTQMFQSLTSVF